MATHSKVKQGSWDERIRDLVKSLSLNDRVAFFARYVRSWRRAKDMKKKGIDPKQR
jgi:hypothetical protein